MYKLILMISLISTHVMAESIARGAHLYRLITYQPVTIIITKLNLEDLEKEKMWSVYEVSSNPVATDHNYKIAAKGALNLAYEAAIKEARDYCGSNFEGKLLSEDMDSDDVVVNYRIYSENDRSIPRLVRVYAAPMRLKTICVYKI
ncbi:MAG: hypothetical protein AB7I27_10620 [Bacteriovoracaceae bacterium]